VRAAGISVYAGADAIPSRCFAAWRAGAAAPAIPACHLPAAFHLPLVHCHLGTGGPSPFTSGSVPLLLPPSSQDFMPAPPAYHSEGCGFTSALPYTTLAAYSVHMPHCGGTASATLLPPATATLPLPHCSASAAHYMPPLEIPPHCCHTHCLSFSVVGPHLLSLFSRLSVSPPT